MKPTQAQIEAAAWLVCPNETVRCQKLCGRCLVKAKKILTAAAGVGEQRACATCHAILADGPQPASCYAATDPAMRDFIADTPISEPNDGWAVEVGWDNFPFTERDKRIAEHVKSEAIERCAQKAREVCEAGRLGTFTDKLVAEILALKDRP